MYALTQAIAGIAGIGLGAQQFRVSTDAPHVIVGVGVIVAALACIYGAVADLSDDADGHGLFTTGVLVTAIALVVWVVRIVHAAATGLVVTFERGLDTAYGAVACFGVGLLLIGAGVEGTQDRHGDVPAAALSICAGIGAIVLAVVAAIAGL